MFKQRSLCLCSSRILDGCWTTKRLFKRWDFICKDSLKTLISGVRMYLSDLVNRHKNTGGGSILAKGTNIVEPVMIHETVKLPTSGTIGPNVVIGANVKMEDGIRIQNSTVLADTILKEHSYINSCIIGRKCSVGRWVRIENNSVIGDDVVIKDELYLNGARVLPHKSISVNVPEPDIIM